VSFVPYTKQQSSKVIDAIRGFLKWAFEVLRNAIVVAGIFVAAHKTNSTGLDIFADVAFGALDLYVFLTVLKNVGDAVKLAGIKSQFIRGVCALAIASAIAFSVLRGLEALIVLIAEALVAK